MKNIPKEIQEDERAVQMYAYNLAEFDQMFSKVMMSRKEFTLRFEIRGNQGRLIHCRWGVDTHDRMSEEKKK